MLPGWPLETALGFPPSTSALHYILVLMDYARFMALHGCPLLGASQAAGKRCDGEGAPLFGGETVNDAFVQGETAGTK